MRCPINMPTEGKQPWNEARFRFGREVLTLTLSIGHSDPPGVFERQPNSPRQDRDRREAQRLGLRRNDAMYCRALACQPPEWMIRYPAPSALARRFTSL